ncbi:MAG: hypothetical protein PHV82_11065 [Victivallaceae bacterium]|nr:hypothetical protein [Victivallaceae bacterium]
MNNDKKNKIILGSGISFASFTILAAIVSAFIPRTAPDPKKLDARTKLAYMATKQFAALPEAEKVKYVKSVGRSRRAYRQLSPAEREKVAQNTRKVRFMEMKERTQKFFKMSREEQNKYLDEMIARQEQRRQTREAGRPRNDNSNSADTNNRRNTSASNTGRRNVNRNARRQGMLEGVDSTTRAQMSEFFRRLRERRQQTQGR